MNAHASEVVLLSDAGPRKDFYRHALRLEGFSIRSEVESETAVCVGLRLVR